MKTFIERLNQFSKVASVIIVAALSIGLTSFVKSCGEETELEGWNRRYEQVLSERDSVLAQNRRLAEDNERRAALIQRDSSLAEEQTRRIARLRQAMEQTQTSKTRLEQEIETLRQTTVDTSQISLKKDTVIALLREDSTKAAQTILSLEQRDSTRLRTINNLTLSLFDMSTRATKAERLLATLPQPPKDNDKWFFGLFNKPTRTQVGLISYGLGVASGFVIK